jgi:ATP synthase protein I
MAVLNSPAFGLIGIGFSLAITIVGMAYLGRWLDGKFGSEPALTLVFLVIGLLAGFVGAYRQLQRVMAARQGRRDR